MIGLHSYIGAFCGGAASPQVVSPDLPQRLGSCAAERVLGTTVGVVGALQAQMGIALLADIDSSPGGRLVTFDGRNFRFGSFCFNGAPEPASQPRFLAPSEIANADFLVDLRAEEEALLMRPRGQRLPVTAFGAHGPTPSSGHRAVLCCRSVLRSWQAAARSAAVWDGEIYLVALGDPTGETP
ncbi:hypothetical protein [Paracoccus sp. (in: a-proteobacteria)]|uniref:hypothetical protein n=1 Tax=Paracoccus sp. TaxID=267 RepID=UPI00396C8A72